MNDQQRAAYLADQAKRRTGWLPPEEVSEQGRILEQRLKEIEHSVEETRDVLSRQEIGRDRTRTDLNKMIALGYKTRQVREAEAAVAETERQRQNAERQAKLDAQVADRETAQKAAAPKPERPKVQFVECSACGERAPESAKFHKRSRGNFCVRGASPHVLVACGVVDTLEQAQLLTGDDFQAIADFLDFKALNKTKSQAEKDLEISPEWNPANDPRTKYGPPVTVIKPLV